MNCEELFLSKFNTVPEFKSFVPYRVCTLGAHIDHQLGHINGFAIDKGMSLVYSHSECVRLFSTNFDGEIKFDTDEELKKSFDWGDYAKSALWSLKDSGYKITSGFKGVIEGTMPVGGLSSSAGVTILYINAFCRLNNITLSEYEFIEIAHKAENQFIGLKCGKLDQSCEVLCKKDNMLHIDTLDSSAENIAIPQNAKPFEIGIFFSGLEHSLVNSNYNLRTEELKTACDIINEKSGKYYGDKLRYIPYEIYAEYESALPENVKKRCVHFYSENQRAVEGTKLFKQGNIEAYGKLITESGYSSIYNYEAGSPELIKLYEILKNTKGVYGTRFSGAGFKGCCLALVDPEYKKEIEETVKEKYLVAFPQHKEKYTTTFCKTADGFGGII